MQVIARVTSSGKEIIYDAGTLMLDGQVVDFDKILEYDGLGVLSWASDDTRAWAYQIGQGAAESSALNREQAPSVENPLRQRLPRLNRPNWVPTLVMLGVLVAWAALIRVTGLVDSRSDITSLGATVLMGVFGFVTIPALVAQFSPRAPKEGIRLTTWVIYVLVAVPLGIGLFWGVADVLHPVQVRAEGSMPNLVALMGVRERDAGRILNGEEGQTNAYDAEDVEVNSRQWGTPTAKDVTYVLEDLNRLDKRPLAKQVQESGQQLVQMALGDDAPKDTPDSDATVVVYYSPENKVVGANFTVSRMAAQEVAGADTREAVLKGVGFTGKTTDVNAPEWYAKVQQATASLDNESYWGFGEASGQWLGYKVDIRHLAALMLNATTDPVTEDSDLGDISITIAPKLIDWATPATASSDTAPASTPAENEPSSAEVSDGEINDDGTSNAALSDKAVAYARELGGKSHKGETLYFIIGASVNYEDMAQQRLDEATLMFGDMQSYFIVQKSGNFEGMEPGWFIVVEAYATKADAEENLDFAKRGFEDGKNSPYIKSAVMKTDEPIPVNYVDVNATGN